MKVSIIIPTYNEAGAIEALLIELNEALSPYPHEWSIVIVDSNSPDGTGALVRSVSTRYPNVHLVEEAEKRGIGMAYITGMQHAIDSLGADVLVSFDGDGQHNPHDIPRLIQGIEEGNDYVIGSRYIDGGDVPEKWASHRKFLSRFGSLYARILLELPIYDATSGMRAMRVKNFAEHLPLTPERMITLQYAYIFQFISEFMRMGAKIKEVPIIFRPRERDVSKTNTLRGTIESLRVTAILRWRTLAQWRFLRVLSIGGIGFIMQTVIFELLGIDFKVLQPSVAILLGGEAAILSNFFLNARYSFQDRVQTAPFMQRLFRFHIVAAGSVVIQWVLVHGVELTVGNVPLFLRLAYFAGVVLGTIVTYAGYYFWVWRSESTNER